MINAGAYKKGEKRPNQGRPKGLANKATTEFRQTVQALLDENRTNVAKWLATVAKDDPGRALDLIAKLAEFAAPKLGRIEHTGEDGSAIKTEVTLRPQLTKDEWMEAHGVGTSGGAAE